MEQFTLEIAAREGTGKSESNRLRREGHIPSIVYHRGEASISASLLLKDFVQLAEKAKASTVFKLKSKDSTLDGKSVVVRDIQKDFTKNKVIHVDFQALKDDEEVTIAIPVVLKGEAPGVKNDGGIVAFVTHELSISCLPKNIPQTIEVDISNLGLNHSIHAKDLALPQGVSLTGEGDITIVSVVAARSTIEAATTEATAEGAAPAAATAATAAAPAKK